MDKTAHLLDEARQHMAAGRFAEAETLCRQILSANPNHPAALHLLGQLASHAGRTDLAIQFFQQSLQLAPDNPQATLDLAVSLMNQSVFGHAIQILSQAIQSQSHFPEAHLNLGIAFSMNKQFEESIDSFRIAIAQRPNWPEAHDGLGVALGLAGKPLEALSEHQEAIKLFPAYAAAHFNLGRVLIDLGRIDDAIEEFRITLLANPNTRGAQRSLLYNLHYRIPYDADLIYREHQKWNQLFAQPLAHFRQPHKNNRNLNRPLRIGYVSADFREHSVSFFIENLLASHNKSNVHVFCYADMSQRDEITDRLKSHVANWRDITNLTDDQLDQMIRHDQIDILVDLAGHTLGDRLLVFARKPAPIQITYLGYTDTTGMTAIDYRLTDAIVDPPGQTDRYHSEKLIRLPATFASYHPPTGVPTPGPLPAASVGHVTFASFANLQKLNQPLLECWADILSKVPNARLTIVAKNILLPPVQQSIRASFEKRGIAADRLVLVDYQSTQSYFEFHQHVDIILDSFPVNGHTVTCHGLWMGVPVITLAGRFYCQRLGISVLTNLGLPELIAQTEQQYIDIAVNLATDLPRLANLRANLRKMLVASPIMDADRFVHDVESVYRTLWQRWCREPQPQLTSTTPHDAQSHFLLGTQLASQGQTDAAIHELNHALSLRPHFPEAHNNLGYVLISKGQIPQAIHHFRQCQTLSPSSPEFHRNLGGALLLAGDLDAAFTALNRAIALNPNDPDAHVQLASAFKSIGDIDKALSHYDRALAIQPNHLLAADNRLFTLNFHHGSSPQQILKEHQRWNDRFAKPLFRTPHPHPPSQPMRIGYISPDFQDHVLGMNLLPLFQHHDRTQFHITCYSNSTREDSVTDLFKQHADQWRPIAGQPDSQVVDQIVHDRIDILVDLALHSKDNRLLVLARKPAPIQATFAGYPGTTGLTAIDYRLTDPYLDPPGSHDAFYAEQSIRLPHSFWCYQPLGDRPPTSPLPALSAGAITFGCLCTFAKVNDAVLELWSRLLKAIPTSKLILLAPQGQFRKQVCAKLQVDPARVQFQDRRPRPEYLKLYHQIDISLDTFPYNGHTTSLDSLWMGVPVVTLCGQTAVSRAGFSQASNLNLPDLVAQTPKSSFKSPSISPAIFPA